jgi:hypothetical protein
MAKRKVSPKTVATRIDKLKPFHLQVEQGIGFSMELEEELKKRGWHKRKTYSTNGKCSYQFYMTKDNMNIDVVTAYFMGTFTEISVSCQTHLL